MLALVKEPCDGQRGGGCSHIRGKASEGLAGGNVGRKVGFLEPGIDLQERQLGSLFRRMRIVGQQRAANRRESDKRRSELGRGLDQSKLGITHGQRIFGLYRHHRMHGVGPAKRGGRNFRIAEPANLAFPDQARKCLCHLFNGDRGITAMNIEQIDPVNTKPRQRTVKFRLQMRRRIVVDARTGVRVPADAGLGCNREKIMASVSLLGEKTADGSFRAVRAVDIRGVDMRNALIKRRGKNGM